MKISHKQILYDLLEIMIVAAEHNSTNTLEELNRQYETELKKIPIYKRNGYHIDYDLLRNSCVCSISPMFKNLKILLDF